MGQYYEIINLDRNEILTPPQGCGAKLLEWGYVRNPLANALWGALSNEWKGDRVFICGDYYDSRTKLSRMCSPCVESIEQELGITQNSDRGVYTIAARRFANRKDLLQKYNSHVSRYAVNTRKHCYLDRSHAYLNDYWITGGGTEAIQCNTLLIDPLVILLAGGNGMGGGDYCDVGINEDLAGTWINDIGFIYTTKSDAEIPKNYIEFHPQFEEYQKSLKPYESEGTKSFPLSDSTLFTLYGEQIADFLEEKVRDYQEWQSNIKKETRHYERVSQREK